jgi:hypothetical protein
MFGLFKNTPSIADYAHNSEILPVAENGDIRGFLVQINDNGKNFVKSVKGGGGQEAVLKFMKIIDDRIASGDFENIFEEVDEMLRDAGIPIKARNLNAERFVMCNSENVFRWVSGE